MPLFSENLMNDLSKEETDYKHHHDEAEHNQRKLPGDEVHNRINAYDCENVLH